MTETNLYFAYGSNLCKAQMQKRCPNSPFIGVGQLDGWKWFINTRGYANILPSPEDVVFGFIYDLSKEDEQVLDKCEHAYSKEYISVKRISPSQDDSVNVLTYIDHERVEEGEIAEEYIVRMNDAIADGIKEGINEEYFAHLRKFVNPLE